MRRRFSCDVAFSVKGTAVVTSSYWQVLILFLVPPLLIGLSILRLRGRWVAAAIALLCFTAPFTVIDIVLLTTDPTNFFCAVISFWVFGVVVTVLLFLHVSYSDDKRSDHTTSKRPQYARAVSSFLFMFGVILIACWLVGQLLPFFNSGRVGRNLFWIVATVIASVAGSWSFRVNLRRPEAKAPKQKQSPKSKTTTTK